MLVWILLLFFVCKYKFLYFLDNEEIENFYYNLKERLSFIKTYKNEIIRKQFSKEYKKNYKLTLEQKEALIGILLGDDYLNRFSIKSNTTLYLEQSYPEKKRLFNESF